MRLATAQPPANAAPNTSAPIRIAALSTVDTFCHAMRRLIGRCTVWFMALSPVWRRTVPETDDGIKPERRRSACRQKPGHGLLCGLPRRARAGLKWALRRPNQTISGRRPRVERLAVGLLFGRPRDISRA